MLIYKIYELLTEMEGTAKYCDQLKLMTHHTLRSSNRSIKRSQKILALTA